MKINWDEKIKLKCPLCGFISSTPKAVLDGHVIGVLHVECPKDFTILAYVNKDEGKSRN